MRQNIQNFALFVLITSGLGLGWWYVDKTYFPKPASREAVLALTGGVAAPTLPGFVSPKADPPPPTPVGGDALLAIAGGVAAPRPAAVVPPKPVPPKVETPADPPTFVALGDDSCYNKVLLTTRGAAVQQVTLTRFDEANRLGLEVKLPGGKPQPLRLIPGVVRPRDRLSLETEAPFPALVPGPVTDADVRGMLDQPSYVLMHYPAKDDPLRAADDADVMNDQHPSTELADRNWKLVSTAKSDAGEWTAVFETALGSPYFLTLRKTYTLGPKDYHVGLKLDLLPGKERAKGKGVFRYQIAGPRGLPIEGEWYTSIYRSAMVGWQTPAGGMKRSFEDAAQIQRTAGGDRVVRAENQLKYAAVATQYFASGIAVDDTAPKGATNPWEYARATREPHPWDNAEQSYLADITVRVAAAPLDFAANEPVTHQYLLYNGPVKVGLLKQMSNSKSHPDWEVDPALVDRYLDKLTLRTLTDYHSPSFFGRLANAIFWADLVIFFTNLMHSILGGLHQAVPVWGLDIVLLTVFIRMILLWPSRKQQASMMKMQQTMAALKPDLDKLHEKYKDDFNAYNQAKTKLMVEHGVNPLSTMGGCVLLFAQMPILMGLYFCLQESVFFRLEPFLWVPNLAAPDMLAWWTEKIPMVSRAENLGGVLYLGPYLNILPLISVALIYTHQRMTLPPPTDEQQEMQQKMMKFMIMFMGLFFYKVAAGLCIYFMCGTLWAIIERQLIPKPQIGKTPPPTDADGKPAKPDEPKPLTGWRAKLKAKLDEMNETANGNRQIRNDPPGPKAERRDRKKKRRK